LARDLPRAQTAIDQALLGCALERYRQSRGQYPVTLALLRPAFCISLPHDLIDGAALRYRRVSPQEFVLYSLGWNQQDDSGNNQNQADWVWKYPANHAPDPYRH
jgi:hypothetical protein